MVVCDGEALAFIPVTSHEEERTCAPTRMRVCLLVSKPRLQLQEQPWNRPTMRNDHKKHLHGYCETAAIVPPFRQSL